MTIKMAVNNITRTLSKNSPGILTAFGVAGLLSTAALSARAAIQIHSRLQELTDQGEWHSDRVLWGTDRKAFAKEFIHHTWRYFVPPVALGVVTAGCIIGANSINARRTAVLMSAYTLTDRTLREYQETTLETVGEKKEGEIRQKIAERQVKADDRGNQIIVLEKNVLCYDTFSGRYFQSNAEAIRKAENDINLACINGEPQSMNDFYFLLGLPQIEMGSNFGWNTDVKLETVFRFIGSEGDEPTLAVDYRRQPMVDFHRIW